MENEIGPIFIDVDGKRVEVYARYEEEEEGFVISASSPDGTETEIYIGFDPQTKEIIFDAFSEKGKSMHNFAAEFPIGEGPEKHYDVSPIARKDIISLINYYAILNNINIEKGAKAIPSRLRKTEEVILKALQQLFNDMDNTEIYACISETTNILESEQDVPEQEPDIVIDIDDENAMLIEGVRERRLKQFCESLEAYIELLRRKSDLERLAKGFARAAEEQRKQGNEAIIEEEVAESGWQVAQKFGEEAGIVAREEVLRWIQEFIRNKKITEIKHLLSEPEEREIEEDEEEYEPDDDEYYGDDEYGDD